ncbi:nuclear transport factor 2 family protein [Winogradskyella sp.]|uniref:nuclear transport factor 2 family protein n=1 Tax=Winogradskyella sp. TaxID=1883156 RepID=UPI001B13A266|nr:nuclear transport factor 2 family protein [Winogradskyella sp.]MBO6879569.1 nuclear transport factor 2 family protein [Winogradskyella sp.]
MKYLFLTLCTSLITIVHSQSETEIFYFDLENNGEKIEVKNGKNISNNKGYDNQPSFIDDEKILYASTRNGQTDIAQYQINYKAKIFINSTEGGEYTPIKIPNKNAVSAVRLDTDGKQRLYSYNLGNGESTELIEDLVVAYYTWYNENTIVSAVIEDEKLNLYVTDLTNGKSERYATNVGRSFHKIPNSNLVSFIYKENDKQWQIRSLNPQTGRTRLIAYTIEGVEDICWLDNKTIITGKEGILYKLTLKQDNNWKKVADLSSYGITNISRLAVNNEATKLLIAAETDTINDNSATNLPENTNTENPNTDTIITEVKAEDIVQKHIEPFNNKNLDEFVDAFAYNVEVNQFPNEPMYAGINTLEENYKNFFINYAKANVKVLNRMVLDNIVIDEELVTINNMTIRQATIYEVEREKIKSMTFIRNKNTSSNPEIIVNKQLEKYNERDIKGFVETYTEDIKLYKLPGTVTLEGLSALKTEYGLFFQQTPDLNAEIVNRIVLGNKVIDKEKVIINGQTFYAIAIYEVNDGLISKVTFVQ